MKKNTNNPNMGNTDKKATGLSILSELLGYDAEMYPNEALMNCLCSKKIMCKKDFMDATGISRWTYDHIFTDRRDDGWRRPKIDIKASHAMKKHLERENLEQHQLLLSGLLWKLMRHGSMLEILNQFWELTGRYVEEEYPEDRDLGMQNYLITPEELNEAVELLFLHLAELDLEWQK